MNRARAAAYVFIFFLYVAALIILIHVLDWQRIWLHFFAGWGILAIVDAVIAKYRNRSCIGWFLLTLIFGPFATIILLLSPKIQRN